VLTLSGRRGRRAGQPTPAAGGAAAAAMTGGLEGGRRRRAGHVRAPLAGPTGVDGRQLSPCGVGVTRAAAFFGLPASV
jgi:hypothetical protein